MVPEMGLFAIILAMGLALFQGLLPLLGLHQHKKIWMQAARPLAIGQSFFITFSFLCLLYAFVQDDFSVAYVAQHSNSALPWYYKISAIWAGHEGSLLLWTLFLSGWAAFFALLTRYLPLEYAARVLSVLGFIALGFLVFLFFTSNPFFRFLPDYPIDGQDLNPLLQDFGLIIHPPLLYLGYVGFSVPFACAVAVLWNKQFNLPWARWMRPWVLMAWGFLTIGIALGSWWAYYELGWGGWWFWDPVENASFMPWLVGIALLHSLMNTDKKKVYQRWALLLSILAFTLSLIGTFLVRSGVLTSVHAFASDPKRGVFLLGLIVFWVFVALLLFAIRSKQIPSEPKIELFSRELLLYLSTILLVVGCGTVLLGTLYPLSMDTLFHQKLSVGFPYFNAVFIPLMIPVLLMIPLGPMIHWGNNAVKKVFSKVRWPLALSLLLSLILPFLTGNSIDVRAVLGLWIGLWIALGTLNTAMDKMKKRGGLFKLSFGAWGMINGHLGMAVMVMGITLVSHYSIEKEVRIGPQQFMDIAQYRIEFKTVKMIEGSHFIGYQGHFVIFKNNQWVSDLFPEKRTFVVQGSTMTETAIDPGFFRDIYIAMGEKLTDNTWSVRVYYKPFIRWIWLGALMMGMGGFLAALGRRQSGLPAR